MPAAVSRRQYRMMMAIAHGAVKDGPRGRPPKSVAAKYTDPGKDAPESKDNDRGGTWGEKHHAKAKEKVKEDRIKRKKSKKELKKSFEEYLEKKDKHRTNNCAAVLVMDQHNRILLATHNKGGLAFPGGHCHADEAFETGAIREAGEETGCQVRISTEIWRGKTNKNNTVVYLGEIATGKPKNTKGDGGHETMTDWTWYEMDKIPWGQLRDCCYEPIKHFVSTRFGKSLKGMVSLEKLEKNIIRQKADAVFEVSHGEALHLVGNGMFRTLRRVVDGMQDEDFKDVLIDTYTLSIRRHMSDVYSGRVNDGHKTVYQFTNKSLPELTAALMSVFEWYLPEDEKELNLLDDNVLSDDAIHGGLNELMDHYKRHNIGNIYEEMETIREQLRNGMAVDLQQVESRIMKLFDKLESVAHEVTGKHNQLAQAVGKDMDELESKLRELQSKIENVDRGPSKVEAFSANPANDTKIHDQYYSYLTKPRIEISPNGKIVISFAQDWQDMEKENFLKDMRAKVITKASKDA
jgi:8-oxo-dGTP pyrophosphatase MutT (NUDIX family)/Txe/YoeB family toxin of Txe-Axe toxin-antitoxin module